MGTSWRHGRLGPAAHGNRVALEFPSHSWSGTENAPSRRIFIELAPDGSFRGRNRGNGRRIPMARLRTTRDLGAFARGADGVDARTIRAGGHGSAGREGRSV